MRKKGLVAGFRSCAGEYLELIRKDLSLDADLTALSFLQKIYVNEKKDPSVDGLYFDCALMKQSLADPDRIMIRSVSSDDENVLSLWDRLVREYSAENGSKPPELTRIARFAMKVSPAAGVHSEICFASSPVIPFPGSGTTAFFRTGDTVLSMTEEVTDNGITESSDGFLLTAGGHMFFEELTGRVHRVYSKLLSMNPSVKFVRCTGNGLLSDIMSVCDHADIMCDVLPSAEKYPEASVRPVQPGAMIFVPEAMSGILTDLCRGENLSCVLLVRCRNDIRGLLIESSGGFASGTKASFESRMLNRTCQMTALPRSERAAAECCVSSLTESGVRGYELGDDVYEALDKLTENKKWAVGGLLSPDDPAVIPFILAANAFVRNTGRAPFCAGFCTGDKTSVRIFTFPEDTVPGKANGER